jgi:hypothetical protein
VVNYVSEGEVANLVRGYVELKGRRVNFSGVAYGRFGGQNFLPQFTAAARRSLQSLVEDVERFEADVQMRLVRGEFDGLPRKGEKHRHQHLGSETQ